MTAPRHASVVVRARDKLGTIERTLLAVRQQTVAAELIVVDSGSTDGTLEVAHRYADRVIEIAPESFTFGGALNVGTAASSGDVVFALSAHSVPESASWIEDSLRLYGRDDVAGTNYGLRSPAGLLIDGGAYHQTRADAIAYPLWGFSNHGSSWRADLWRDFPFREDLAASEDKEWSWCVLSHGWTIAYAPGLKVSDGHRRAAGLAHYGRRIRKERAVLMGLGGLARPTLQQSLAEWWLPEQRPEYPPLAVRRLSPFRLVEIGATLYAGCTAPVIPDRVTRPAVVAGVAS